MKKSIGIFFYPPRPSRREGDGKEVGTLFYKPPLLEDFVRLRTKSPLKKEEREGRK
jgi:hypothetical protein